ncbi:MAG: serine/threonine-protein kinase, partial [Pirellulales bacterium]
MNLRATRTGPVDEPRGSTMKFTYPSGSSPLSGYTLKRGVGRGGFGEVYYATSDAGKEVALKLIRRNLDVELRGVRQCLNLKHPNLVGIYDIRIDDHDDRWVVMEYVSGESLEEAIERNPHGMPVDQALFWMHGITTGVAYLHDHGIVHRDLKPGNIFSDEGIVKIGDYGLSKFISCSRRSGQTESVGTVHYMAPEIANGRYGREIDTYALAIILYEMLTGRVPFEGQSVGEVLMKHLTAEADLEMLEAPYRDIVARGLAKDPQQRLQSAAELVALLPPLPADVGSASPRYYASAAPPASDARSADFHRENYAATVEVVEDREPVYRAVRQGWKNLEAEWNRLELPPLVKTAILAGAIVLMVLNIGIWAPPTLFAMFAYGCYWIVRAALFKPRGNRSHRGGVGGDFAHGEPPGTRD